jgi:predicted ATP-binding protein involved in virulence
VRIQSIAVKKLFGQFDHLIPLNQEERITLLYGQNGTGKTTIFRLLDQLFGGEQSRGVLLPPFEEFSVRTEEGELLIEQKSYEHENDSGEKYFSAESFFITPDKKDRLSSVKDAHQREDLTLPTPSIGLKPSLQTFFVEENRRLFPRSFQEKQGFSSHPEEKDYSGKGKRYVETISLLPNHLKAIMRDEMAAFSQVSQELDASFPRRMLGNGTSLPVLSPEALQEKFQEIQEKQERLAHFGLIKETEKANLDQPVSEDNAKVLTIFLQDLSEKLATIDSLLDRLTLFAEILEDRFLFKRLLINKAFGFRLVNKRDEELELEALSSGEQHQLILLYYLLFVAKPDTLVLLDEPEISLHILWQERFVDDLKKIVALQKIDILLATHSPNIINHHWNLAVSLDPKEEMATT